MTAEQRSPTRDHRSAITSLGLDVEPLDQLAPHLALLQGGGAQLSRRARLASLPTLRKAALSLSITGLGVEDREFKRLLSRLRAHRLTTGRQPASATTPAGSSAGPSPATR